MSRSERRRTKYDYHKAPYVGLISPTSETRVELTLIKIDGVGPVDKRPSID